MCESTSLKRETPSVSEKLKSTLMEAQKGFTQKWAELTKGSRTIDNMITQKKAY